MIKRPFGIVAHDAGGMNQLVGVLAEMNLAPDYVDVRGPALRIWKCSEFGQTPITNYNAWINEVSSAVIATGWMTNLENCARRSAHQLGVKVISILDNWSNFKNRFMFEDEYIDPGEIWVTDDVAFEICLGLFENSKIFLVKGSYDTDIINSVRKLQKQYSQDKITYLTSPSASKNSKSKTEIDRLDLFIKNMQLLGANISSEINICVHPSESTKKYDDYCNIYDGRYNLRVNQYSLAESFARSWLVVGTATYPMSIALKLGKKVCCLASLTPDIPSLPHNGIIHLSDLLQKGGANRNDPGIIGHET